VVEVFQVSESDHTCDACTGGVSVDVRKKAEKRGTYKDPKANIRQRAIRFRSVKFRTLSSPTGRNMMTRSSKIENAAPEIANSCISRHLP
jgi:hypothetical protein